MRYGILGPVEVWEDGVPVPVGGPQQRALLAVLLVNAGAVVTSDRLIDHLWGERPPANARARLHRCVADLRRVLRGPAGRQPLRTRPPGYLLEVLPGELDADRFEELVAAARNGPPREAAALLYRALGVWRGRPLDGVAVDGLAPDVARLAERRLEVVEQRIDVDLRLGRDQGLVGQLRALVSEHPVRERLWVLLMRALQQAGRQADALAAYRELRETLIDELGLEPGEAARRTHQSILAGEEDPAAETDREERVPAPVPPAPAQLPAPVPAFTGRADQLKALDELAEQERDMVIVAITGTAGSGKTTLAVHWAHQARHRFPDGQLYANLRGFAAGEPAAPIAVLAGFLRALGVPAEQVPVEPEPAAALYRSTVAGRRVLVVLDNAASADQVRPLLPGSPGCLVVVTSRDRLRGLVARDGARRLGLGVLAPDEASVLLRRLLGPDRVAAEPAAVDELARLCAYLPLALRIAAADLAGPIADYVTRLRHGDRLSVLEVDGDPASAVRAAFDLSYAALDPAARRLFRLRGLLPVVDVTAPAAAALAAITVAEAGRLLERLATAHLLEPASGGRYACHDLLWSYAEQRAAAEEPAQRRDEAVSRWFGWYTARSRAAARTLNPEMLRLPAGELPDPGFDSHRSALAWLDTERSNLVAAVRHAAANPAAGPAWLLADALRGYFWARMHGLDWLAVASAGLAAAVDAGNRYGQAAALLSLGDAHNRQGRNQRAIDHYGRALARCQEAGWTDGEAVVLGNLGIAYQWLPDLQAAAAHHERALALARHTGRLAGEAVNTGNLGNVYSYQGDLRRAADHFRRSLELHRLLGSPFGEAVDLSNLGDLELEMGRWETACAYLDRALTLDREVGHRDGEAITTRVLADAYRVAGQPERARELARRAIALNRETGSAGYEADARNALGRCEQALGRAARAAAHHERALALAAVGHNRHAEVVALVGLAGAVPETERAIGYAERALAAARRAGYRLQEGYALRALGDARRRAGDPTAAQAAWREALALLDACGSAAATALRARLR